jgi:hypothetical protein
LSAGQSRSFHAVYVILFNAETMLDLLQFLLHFHSNKTQVLQKHQLPIFFQILLDFIDSTYALMLV